MKTPSLTLPVSCLLIGVLMFIWPIPGTIAARYWLLAASLAWFGGLAWRNSVRIDLGAMKQPLLWLGALAAWIVLNAAVIASEPSWTFGEIRGQWLYGSLVLFLGGLVAANVARLPTGEQKMTTAILLALMAHVTYVVGSALLSLLQREDMQIQFARLGGLTAGADTMNYLTLTAVSILLAEILLKTLNVRSASLLGRASVGMFFGLCLASSYLESLRNGTVVLLLMLGMAATLYWQKNRARANHISLIVLALLTAVLLAASFSGDKRWRSFVETVPLALDTASHKAWLDDKKYPYPCLSNGDRVDDSNYKRIAWAAEGVRLVLDQPLGSGYGRTAFGHRLVEKYGEGRPSSHSHSGVIDLAIGLGIPGLILWLGFLLSLAAAAWRAWRNGNNAYALALLFVLAGFSIRTLVDNPIRDHMLHQFLFLAGFLGVAALARPRQAGVSQT